MYINLLGLLLDNLANPKDLPQYSYIVIVT